MLVAFYLFSVGISELSALLHPRGPLQVWSTYYEKIYFHNHDFRNDAGTHTWKCGLYL